MKYFLVLAFSIPTAFAIPCITSGQCPQDTLPAHSCYVVETGVDAQGTVTCRKQCWSTPLAYICKKYPNVITGRCVRERAINMHFDPSSPEACANAQEIE